MKCFKIIVVIKGITEKSQVYCKGKCFVFMCGKRRKNAGKAFRKKLFNVNVWNPLLRFFHAGSHIEKGVILREINWGKFFHNWKCWQMCRRQNSFSVISLHHNLDCISKLTSEIRENDGIDQFLWKASCGAAVLFSMGRHHYSYIGQSWQELLWFHEQKRGRRDQAGIKNTILSSHHQKHAHGWTLDQWMPPRSQVNINGSWGRCRAKWISFLRAQRYTR